ncbi:MAG: anthranilate synthase component I [Candidatus Omnitrophota bacterium]|nr:MAG: anthranilate synthase component I [Candidatus Omnitrophota bacterium]
MYTPTLKEFLKLSQRYNVIPVYKEIGADLDTPVSSFLKIKKNEYAFLLESVEGQEKIARYSFLGSNPSVVIKTRGRAVEVLYERRTHLRRFITQEDPLTELKKLMEPFKAARVKGLPRFYGGFVGYMGYDFVQFLEDIPSRNKDELNVPDSIFMLTESILVFDHVNHTIKIIYNVMLPEGRQRLSRSQKVHYYQAALQAIERIHADFKNSLVGTIREEKKRCAKKIKPVANITRAQFCRSVQKARSYIRKGDVIQVVLSQRFKVALSKKPFDVYRDLRSLNPSPYMFFLRFKELTLIGSSPEMLVRFENKIVETRPIAGTRPRGRDAAMDEKLMLQLLADKKEKAEHIMLVDLGRNDVGRVCKPGKVKVNEFMEIEKYSHVMHLVSDITGVVDSKYNAFDCLKACFPAGTVTGSPKVRAMQIIEELETTRRGPYAGCVGYFSFSRAMDTCITIRTIVAKGAHAYVQAGAGIVLDSVPAREYNESVNKAKALMEAIAR